MGHGAAVGQDVHLQVLRSLGTAPAAARLIEAAHWLPELVVDLERKSVVIAGDVARGVSTIRPAPGAPRPLVQELDPDVIRLARLVADLEQIEPVDLEAHRDALGRVDVAHLTGVTRQTRRSGERQATGAVRRERVQIELGAGGEGRRGAGPEQRPGHNKYDQAEGASHGVPVGKAQGWSAPPSQSSNATASGSSMPLKIAPPTCS